MRRFLTVLFLFLALPAWGWDFLTFPNFPQRGQGHTDKIPWWYSGLTFYAPFDDPSNPLRLIKGTGSFTFTRATTATYLHPSTGLITSAASGQLRIESGGALIEGQRTFVLLWSRTFDNEAWVATNAAVAANQTGEDGVANSAYSLWSTADNGTLCQAVTIASAAYSGAFSVKRITGTGAVQLSLDNGATWGSDVSSSLSTSAWYRASKSNQTLANPELCLRLATSGDNVAIDYAQLEAGAFVSSRIPTTTAAVTRNADVLSFQRVGNLASPGTVFVELGTEVSDGDVNKFVIGMPSGNNFKLLTNPTTGHLFQSRGLSGNAYGDWNGGHLSSCKFAIAWDNASIGSAKDGVDLSPTYTTGTGSIEDTIYVGSINGSNSIFTHIKNLLIWDRAFSNAELQAVTR